MATDQILQVPTFEELQNEQIGYIHYIRQLSGFRNIRSNPSISGQDIGDLYPHELIHFYPDSNQNSWYYIQKKNDLFSGWVLVDNKDLIFVKEYNGSPQLPNYMSLTITGYNLDVQTNLPE